MSKSSGRSCACASRPRTSATNRSPCSTCISEPWRALGHRKQKRRSAKPATNFWFLKGRLFSPRFNQPSMISTIGRARRCEATRRASTSVTFIDVQPFRRCEAGSSGEWPLLARNRRSRRYAAIPAVRPFFPIVISYRSRAWGSSVVPIARIGRLGGLIEWVSLRPPFHPDRLPGCDL